MEQCGQAIGAASAASAVGGVVVQEEAWARVLAPGSSARAVRAAPAAAAESDSCANCPYARNMTSDNGNGTTAAHPQDADADADADPTPGLLSVLTSSTSSRRLARADPSPSFLVAP